MSQNITLHGETLHTYKDLPIIGEQAPSFELVDTDLSLVRLEDFKGRSVLINIYPSIDTTVCLSSVENFSNLINDDIECLCVSMDLPFSLARAKDDLKTNKIKLLSDFRNRSFGDAYGLTIEDGPVAGLLARAVIVLDKDHKIMYHQLVADLSQAPDYQAALDAIVT